jgi:hypothetical protein
MHRIIIVIPDFGLLIHSEISNKILANGHQITIITSGRCDPPTGWRTCLSGDIMRLQQLRRSRTSDMSVRSGRMNQKKDLKEEKL